MCKTLRKVGMEKNEWKKENNRGGFQQTGGKNA